jgi:hypothetical protein
MQPAEKLRRPRYGSRMVRRNVRKKEIDALAEKYYRIAHVQLQFITEQNRDPNLLVRAVRYLAHTHALPPMGKDTEWFSDMLGVLIELACPNTGLPPPSPCSYPSHPPTIRHPARPPCPSRSPLHRSHGNLPADTT